MKTDSEDNKKKDKDIVYNKTVKAGKRIYYFDVKRSRNNEMYMAITESKKIVSGDLLTPDISFEKHKIFLYHEDMSNFAEALLQVIQYIKERQAPPPPREQYWKKREEADINSVDDDENTKSFSDILDI
jgi:hypothetical protein